MGKVIDINPAYRKRNNGLDENSRLPGLALGDVMQYGHAGIDPSDKIPVARNKGVWRPANNRIPSSLTNNMVNTSPSLPAIIDSLEETMLDFNITQVEIPANITAGIEKRGAHYRLPKKDWEEMKALDSFAKSQIALSMISAFHDYWAIEHAPEFFLEHRFGDEYLFLPIELIGEEGLFWFAGSISWALQTVGLDETVSQLEQENPASGNSTAADQEDILRSCPSLLDAYHVRRSNFLVEHGIGSMGELVGFITRYGREHSQIRKDVAKALEDRETALRIALQVVSHGPSRNMAEW